MLLIVGISFAPLILFILIGLFLILFPKTALNLKHYSASIGGSLFDNYLEFTDTALLITRISGVVFILLGVAIFLLVNGWLDSLIL